MTALRLLAIGLPLTAAIADLIAVAVVLAGARDRRVANSFALMALCMAGWNALWGVRCIPGFAAAHETTVAVLALASPLLPGTVFHNAVVWSRNFRGRMKQLVILVYAIALIFCVLRTGGLVIAGFVNQPWGSYGRAGALFPLFVAPEIAPIIAGFFLCLQTLKQEPAEGTRLLVKYWLLAAAFGFPLGATNLLTNYGFPIFPMGALGTMLAIGIVAYAAVRHRLMDIDVFIMRLATTLLASAAVVLPIAGVVIWAHHLPVGVSGALVIGCLLLPAIVSLLVFSRFRSYLEQEVESSFFPTRRAGRGAIRQLSADLVQLPPHADGGQRFTETLMEGLGLHGIALYLRKKSGIYKLACARGDITAPTLLHRQGFPKAGGASSLAHAGWESCVPVRADGADLGFIVLGPKRSGAAIDDADMALLALVASQLAVGLKNAEYVRAIRRQQREIDELRKRLEAENIALRSEVRSASQSGEIIGSSVALQRVLALVEKVAPTDASILITGDTGTGKELIARAIHDLSPRRNGPLISVNCPAIPPELATSELFGHERGAFTGATEARPGKFELADGGTIFLDEIADLPMRVQVKLLRVLQEREVQRLGGRTVRQLDLRVVAATNHDLEAAMRAGRFREDLYYRLAAVRIALPPLRERTEDIPLLASFFLERAARTHQRVIKGFTAEALAALYGYSWPGNIRELQNVIERAVLLCTGDVIRPEYLSELAVSRGVGPRPRAEKLRRIEQALAQTGGNHAAAARLLGVSPSNLARMIKNLSAKLPPAVH